MPFFFTVIIILIEFVKFLLENVLIDNLESRTFSFVFFSSPPLACNWSTFWAAIFPWNYFSKKKSMNLSFGPASSTTLSPMKHGVRSINIVYVNETLFNTCRFWMDLVICWTCESWFRTRNRVLRPTASAVPSVGARRQRKTGGDGGGGQCGASDAFFGDDEIRRKTIAKFGSHRQ